MRNPKRVAGPQRREGRVEQGAVGPLRREARVVRRRARFAEVDDLGEAARQRRGEDDEAERDHWKAARSRTRLPLAMLLNVQGVANEPFLSLAALSIGCPRRRWTSSRQPRHAVTTRKNAPGGRYELPRSMGNCRSNTLHCCCACLEHLSKGNCCPCWACDNGPYTTLCCWGDCYCECGRGLTEKEKRCQNATLARDRAIQRKDADQQDFFRGRGKYAKATELKTKGGGGGGSSPGGRGTSSGDRGAVDSRDVDWTPDHGFGSSYSGGDDTD